MRPFQRGVARRFFQEQASTLAADQSLEDGGEVRRGGIERQSGFSLLEVMMSMTLFAAIMMLTASMLAAVGLNPRATRATSTTQAQSRWMESVTNRWAAAADFGNLALLSPPPEVDGYSWSLKACLVSPVASALSSCNTARNGETLSYLSSTRLPVTTVASSQRLVNLELAYTPQAGTVAARGGEGPRTVVMQFARREDDSLE